MLASPEWATSQQRHKEAQAHRCWRVSLNGMSQPRAITEGRRAKEHPSKGAALGAKEHLSKSAALGVKEHPIKGAALVFTDLL